jgi:hypothetical protein
LRISSSRMGVVSLRDKLLTTSDPFYLPDAEGEKL